MKQLITKITPELQQELNDAWLGINVRDDQLYNPLTALPLDDNDCHIHLSYLLRQPEYFPIFTKDILNVEMYPTQALIMQYLWNHRFPMLIAARGYSKTYSLAMYAILRAIFVPGRKIVIAGSVFRQSKLVFEYILGILSRSPSLKHLCRVYHADKYIERGNDQWRLKIGDSTITAIPIGDGGSVRGLRANDLIVEEFASHNRDIFETVLSGFIAVSSNPLEKLKNAATQKLADKYKIILEDQEDSFAPENQMILCGTAYYQFNHFYEYWKLWKSVIESENLELLKRDDEEELDANLKADDFCVIRIPVELIPDGFMDQAQISRSKASMHSGNFLCEFGACITDPDQLITTQRGYIPYQDLLLNDKVLTHNGVFKSIINKTCREYSGDIYKIQCFGSNEIISVTEDHPFWINNKFNPISVNTKNLELPLLKELSGLSHIDISKYVKSGITFDNYVRSKYPNQKMSQSTIDNILTKNNDGYNPHKISKEENLPISNVYNVVKNNNRKTKGSLNRFIDLDYNFGLIVGYYASEGSRGSGGLSTGFALGKHETKYINQLISAIKTVFDIDPKVYINKNVANVFVNSRIFGELISYICEGNACTKSINPDFLYSNSEFLRGFIEGIINGDGCIHKNIVISIQLTSRLLISQLKIALSYFGIFASYLDCYWRDSRAIIYNKEVNQSSAYRLDIRGEYFDKYMNLIYNRPVGNRSSKTRLNDNKFILSVKSITKETYDGLVYNLEIKDDYSFCFSNSASHNCFAADSNGFYKRSLVESCVCKPGHVKFGDKEIVYYPKMGGDHNKRYVMGIDVASEKDNFAIIVIEIDGDLHKIVYGWTITRKEQKKRVSEGLITENDFYYYCSLKIRELMKSFQIEKIGMDAQGGGIAILEALSRVVPDTNERPIFEIIDPSKFKETDTKAGLHIVEMVQFASPEWTRTANHTMRTDLEHKTLLFPAFDSLSLGFAERADNSNDTKYDTIEDCVVEIEELKDELSSIIVTETSTGRERWDTPDTKVSGQVKRKMKKDRYSALLIANYIARTLDRRPQEIQTELGGFAYKIKTDEYGPEFTGPESLVNKFRNLY